MRYLIPLLALNAEKLFSNPGIRDAAVARARADLEIVAGCPK